MKFAFQVEALPRYLPVCQYAIKNTRRKMEDRHVMLQDLNTLYDLDVSREAKVYSLIDLIRKRIGLIVIS